MHILQAVALLLLLSSYAAAASPWVYSGDEHIPAGTIRVTTLGSGSPDVHKEQVCVGHCGASLTQAQRITL